MADLCFPKGPPHFFLVKAPESPPDDAVSEDRTHLDDFEGWMTKQSVRGFWQQRYFALNNGYLNYYADKTRPALLGSLDLSKCTECEPTSDFTSTGEFRLVFSQGGSRGLEGEYCLRAGREASAWMDVLELRKEWAKSSAARKGGAQKGSRRGGVAEDEEEGGGGGGGRGGKKQPPLKQQQQQVQQKGGRNGRGGVPDEDEEGGEEDEEVDARGRGIQRSSSGTGLGKKSTSFKGSSGGGGGGGGRRPAKDEDEDEEDEEEETGRGNKGKGVGAKKGGRGAVVEDEEDEEEEDTGASRRSNSLISRSASMKGTGKAAAPPLPPPPPKRDSKGRGGRKGEQLEEVDEDEDDEEEEEEEEEEVVGLKRGGGKKGGKSAAAPPPPPPPPQSKGGKSQQQVQRRRGGGDEDGGDSDLDSPPPVKGDSSKALSRSSKAAPSAPVDSDEEEEEEEEGKGAGKRGKSRGGGRGAHDDDDGEEEEEEGEEGGGDVELIAWVKKRPPTKFGVWQSRLLKLSGGVIYFHETEEAARADEFSSNLPVTSISQCKLMCGPGVKATNDKEKRALLVNGDALSFENEAVRDEWLSALQAAMAAFSRGGGGGGGRNGGGGGGGGDSDDDAPVGRSGGGGGGGGAPPLGLPPKWFKDYEGKTERSMVKWATATSTLTTSLFNPVAEAGMQARARAAASEDGDGEGGGSSSSRGGGDGSTSPNSSRIARQATSATVDAMLKSTTAAADVLLERCSEAIRRGRGDVVKHLVKAFDVSFYNALTILTSGNELGRLGARALMQLLDCVQSYMGARGECLKGFRVGELEGIEGVDTAASEIEATLGDFMDRYVDVTGESLAANVASALDSIKGKNPRTALVLEAHIGSRYYGTQGPTDLFNTIVSVLLKDLRKAGSRTLVRRVLSIIFSQLASFSQLVMMDAMDEKEAEDVRMAANPHLTAEEDTVMGYLTAVINDTGLLLDHTEQLEAYFADALEPDAGLAGEDRGGGEDKDKDKDRELASLENDISRSKDSILASGMQVLGQWINMISDELKPVFGRLFGSAWGPCGPSYPSKDPEPILVVCDTVECYLSDLSAALDPFFFRKFAQMILAHIVEAYLLRLLTPDTVAKFAPLAPGHKKATKLTTTKKSDQDRARLQVFFEDKNTLGRQFSKWLGDGGADVQLITTALRQTADTITIPSDYILETLTTAIVNNISVSTHVYMAFLRCLELRDNLTDKERLKLGEEGRKVLLEYGAPPSEEDDELSMRGVGLGVMTGQLMCSDTSWSSGGVTASIYRSLFPNAVEQSKVYFKGWTPREAMGGGGGGGGGGGASLPAGGGKAPAGPTKVLDLSSFLGGKSSGSGGGGGWGRWGGG